MTWEAAQLWSALEKPTREDSILQKFDRFPNGDPDKWAWTRYSFVVSEAAVRKHGQPQGGGAPGTSDPVLLEVWSRAEDNEGNRQPLDISEVWKGDLYYNNSVDKVRMMVQL